MKQPIDEGIIRGLQDAYYSEEPRALSMMYCEARHIASVMLNSLSVKKRLILSNERSDQIIHDAASRFVSQYIKRPGFWVDHFSVRIKWDVKYFLFNGGHGDRPKQTAERNTISLDTINPSFDDAEMKGERSDYVQDLYSEHDRGTDILLTIFHATSFKQAVIEVSAIAGKAWCYDRAAKLHEVYRMTRRREWKRRNGNGRIHVKRAPEGVVEHASS